MVKCNTDISLPRGFPYFQSALKITTIDLADAAGPPQQLRGVLWTPGTLPGCINQLNRDLLLQAYLRVRAFASTASNNTVAFGLNNAQPDFRDALVTVEGRPFPVPRLCCSAW